MTPETSLGFWPDPSRGLISEALSIKANSSVAPAPARTKEEMFGAIPLIEVEPMMTEKRTLLITKVSYYVKKRCVDPILGDIYVKTAPMPFTSPRAIILMPCQNANPIPA